MDSENDARNGESEEELDEERFRLTPRRRRRRKKKRPWAKYKVHWKKYMKKLAKEQATPAPPANPKPAQAGSNSERAMGVGPLGQGGSFVTAPTYGGAKGTGKTKQQSPPKPHTPNVKGIKPRRK